ncbi:MAG: c-type cytochrome [Planctomycetota bacterium]|nr:c-type cytochrome [Planctomycetota bacterium]
MPLLRRVIKSLVIYSVILISLPGTAQDKEADSVDRDYAAELPRIKPVEAKDALSTFTIADGFRIEQVAAEPNVVDPIAMAFDENGRLFVVEMRDYSEDGDLNLGRIRLLEDTNGDGLFETSYIYAEGLSWPTALTCYNGGLFVGAAPDIYYLKDTDGDNRADVKKTVFTGFGRGNVQGLINTFKWGLDNRIHGATSSSGADVTKVGDGEMGRQGDGETRRQGDKETGSLKEETKTTNPSPPLPLSPSPPLSLRGRDFAIEPRTMTMEATSGGGQHGLSFNQWGDKFVCSNSNHAQYVQFEDRYIARNPYFAAPSPRASIAADGPQADVYRTSPIEPWRIVRTRLRVKGIVPGPVEGGGTPAGYFTGATGITIIRGNGWPSEFQGWAIVGDVGSNLVHRKRIEQDGASYIARRVDEKSELLTSSDVWFRPAQFANAPDGAMYIADMYRETIEHPLSLPPVIKKHLDLTSGRDRGRIYRIVGKDFQQPPLPRLGKASTATLVTTLGHANGWHRETASRLLYERQDRSAIPLLEMLVVSGHTPEARIHALHALDGLDGLSSEVILRATRDAHPRVREHAVRLSERVAGTSAQVRERLYSMVDDKAFRVRYQLAFTLGELSGPSRNHALVSLVKRDGSEGLLQVAVMSSLAEGAGDVLAELAQDADVRESQVGRGYITSLAAQIGKQQRGDDIAAVLRVLGSLPKQETETIQAIVQGLAAKQGSDLAQQLAAVTGGQAEQLMKDLLSAAASTAENREAELEARVGAVQRLRLGELDGRETLFASLLTPTEPGEIQAAAIATLATYDSPGVAKILVAQWRGLSPRLRGRAGDVLFSRDAWIPQLLTAVEAGDISMGDLEPTRMKLLASHRDESIRMRAARLLAATQSSDRNALIVAYRESLEMPGDATRGKAVFTKVCATCHQLEGVGHAIAPNLAAMRNRGPEAILANVLVPNREVNPQYLNYVLLTTDGRSLTGMIAAETATSVTLKRADNVTDTVLRIDIEELQSTGVSLMPEGMEKQIDKPAMADLITYLLSIR